MSARLLSAIPLIFAIVLLAAGGAPPMWPVAIGLATLASVVSARRAKLTTFASLLWMIAGAAPPILWARFATLEMSGALPPALVFLGVATVRRFFDEPLFGRQFDRALAVFACIAIGLGLKSGAYPYLVVAFAAALLVDFGGGADALRSIARAPRASIALGAVTAIMATGAALALPAIDRATNRRFERMFMGPTQRTGFSPHVRLDDSSQIHESDEVVLRLSGAETDYLRGAVFDSFDGSDWSVSAPRLTGTRKNAVDSAGPRTEVEAATPSFWIFAQRGSEIVSDIAWEADGLGIFHPTTPRTVRRYALATASVEVPDEPAQADILVLRSLMPRLRPLARAWTAGANDDRQRAEALVAHLTEEYSYTLDRPRYAYGKSELIDFLFVHKTGHCEFFASAFVLLARSIGVPARLVAGYRVVEHNGFGGYAVVRAKHAHAWAEACVAPKSGSGACHFETVDPTPPGVPTLAGQQPRTASAFFDYLQTSALSLYRAALDAPERSLPVLGAIVAVAFALRALRNRRIRRSRGAGEDAYAPPPAFVRFERALAAEGFVRAPAEPLESLAAKLAAAGRAAPSLALRRYMRARYGPGQSTDGELEAALTEPPR